MKKVQKGFTLVELIVVITILAILATIAFISLQGYSQDAKNSKVASDLRNLTSAIETSLTKGNTTMATTLDDTLNTGVTGFVLADAATAYSGAYTLSGGTNYGVGGINFVGIKQNGADFKDNEDTARDYVYAYTASGEDGGYQVAGETANSAGTSVTYVKGSYLQEVGTDAAGLVLGTTAGTGGILNEATDTIAGGY